MNNNNIILPRDVALLAVKDWLTADEAAMYLDLSTDKVKRLAQSRELAHSKRGTRLYFRKADLNAWLDACRVAGADEAHSVACTYTALNPLRNGRAGGAAHYAGQAGAAPRTPAGGCVGTDEGNGSA